MTTPVATLSSPPTAVVPVMERIVQDVLLALAQITKANGYSVDAIPCRPNPGIGNAVQNGRMVVYAGDKSAEPPPEQMLQWIWTLHILCQVRESETSGVTIDQRRASIQADVEWALTFDRDSQTRSFISGYNLAEDTIPIGATYGPIAANAHEGELAVNVQVRYRTPYGNPYNSIYDPPPPPPPVSITGVFLFDPYDGNETLLLVRFSGPIQADAIENCAGFTAARSGGGICAGADFQGPVNDGDNTFWILEMNDDVSATGGDWAIDNTLPGITPGSGTFGAS